MAGTGPTAADAADAFKNDLPWPSDVPRILAEQPKGPVPIVTTGKHVPAPEEPYKDRLIRFLTSPPEAVQGAVDELNQIMVGPFRIHQRALIEPLAGMTSPVGIGAALVSGGLGGAAASSSARVAQAGKAGSAALGVFFAGESIRNVVREVPEALKDFEKGDYWSALGKLGSAGTSAYLAFIAARHAHGELSDIEAIGETRKALQARVNAEEHFRANAERGRAKNAVPKLPAPEVPPPPVGFELVRAATPVEVPSTQVAEIPVVRENRTTETAGPRPPRAPIEPSTSAEIAPVSAPPDRRATKDSPVPEPAPVPPNSLPVESPKPTQLAPTEQAPATRQESPVPTGFETSKGSTYTVSGESTTRTKSLHQGHDPKDVGEKPPSAKTVYVDPKFATEVGMWNTSSGTGKRIVLDGNKVVLVSKSGADRPLGRDQIINDSAFTAEPAAGLSPLELFEPNENGHYRGNHPGNPITKISRRATRHESPVPPLAPGGHPPTVYHGTGQEFEEFEQGRAKENSLYGPGFYHTEDATVASSYARGGSGNVRPAKLDIRKVFDVDATADPKLSQIIGSEAKTNHALYHDAVQQFGNKSEVNDWLLANGYDGITHVGGKLAGKGKRPHRVWIAFEPTQVRPAFSAEPAVQQESFPVRTSEQSSEVQAPKSETYQPGKHYDVTPSKFKLDPVRFQFKQEGVGQKGVTDQFKEVKKWNPDLAGTVHAWLDPADQQVYPVNGHHRVDLAQRIGDDGVGEGVHTKMIDAGNAQEARAKGALINIAEGNGTAIDVAKFLRDSGLTRAKVEAEGDVVFNKKPGRQGAALANLSQPIFDDVVSGRLPIERAAIIGEGLPSHADQKILMEIIRKTKPTNERIEEMIRLANGGKKVAKKGDGQGDLFGDVEDVQQSLLGEKADISVYVRSQLGAEKKLFAAVGNQGAAERLGAHGNVIKAGENAEVAQQASQGLEIYDRLSGSAGQVDAALERAAVELANGGDPNAVKQRAYKEIRAHVLAEADKLAGVRQRDAGEPQGVRSRRIGEARRGQQREDLDPLQQRKVEQASLVSQEAEAESRAIDQSNKDKLLGKQLTAQIKSGLPARPAKLKPTETRSLFEDEGPEQGSLFQKRLDGPVYRPNLTPQQKTAEAQVETARAGREKYPILRVNAQAMDLLHEANGTQGGHEALGVTFTSSQAERILRKLDTESRVARLKGDKPRAAKLQELRSVLLDNRAAAKGRPMVMVQAGSDITPEQFRGALHEELDHATQLEATGDIYGYHVDAPTFLGTPYGKIAAKTMRETGVVDPDAPDSHVAMEVGVRLMRPGRHVELNLSEDQALILAENYADLLIERHGPEKVLKVTEKIYDTIRQNLSGKNQTSLGARRSGSEAKSPARTQGETGGQGPPKGPEASGNREVGPPDKPLQQRKVNPEDEGPEFKKQTKDSALDIFRPVRERIRRQGDAGVELMRKVDRADNIGVMRAGKRVTRLNESGLQKLSAEERFGAPGSLLDILQGNAEPTGKAGEVAKEIRALLDETAAESIATKAQTKRQVTLRPGDPIPEGAQLKRSQREALEAGHKVHFTYTAPFRSRRDYAPHVIPSAEELRKGPKRQDAIANMVHEGTASTRAEAAAIIDDWRKFRETGERARKLEKNLIDTGQARDAIEAFGLLKKMKRATVKRSGSVEYSRSVRLPFYDPDMLRVLPKWMAGTSMRLAQIQEFGQELGKGRREIESLLKLVEAGGGNEAFTRAAINRGLRYINEGPTPEAKIARLAMTWNGFKLGTAFIPNAFQGGLNTFLHTHDPVLTAKAMSAVFTKRGRRFASQSGASIDGMINEMVRSVSSRDDVLGKALEKYLAPTFTPTERGNRIVAANAGKLWAEKMLDRLKKNPKDGLARQELNALGLKPDVLLKLGKVEGDAALMAGKRFADITQFRSQVWDQPDWATSSVIGKLAWQFKNYSYQQFRLVYNDSVGEIRAGRPGRGLMTFAILALIFPVAGEVINDVRAALRGKKRPPEGFKRYFEDLAQGGALGTLADVLQSASYGKIADFVAGPTASTAAKGAEAVFMPAAKSETRWKRIEKFLAQQTSPTSIIYDWLNPPKKKAMSPEMKKLLGL